MNKSFILSGAVLMLSLGFVACSDDDDSQSGNSGNKVKPEICFTQGIPSQVGDLEIKTNAAGLVTEIIDDGDVIKFSYERVSRATTYDVTMKYEDDAEEFYIQLNEKGFAKYVLELNEDADGNPDEEEWWFTYNDKNQMISMTRTDGNKEVTTITYNADGDITKVHMKSDPDPENPGDRSEMNAETVYSINGSALIDNKGGIMMYDECFRIDMDEFAPAYYAGLLGCGTKHLPVKTTEDDDYVYSFTWTLNANGLPSNLQNNATGPDDSYTDIFPFKW